MLEYIREQPQAVARTLDGIDPALQSLRDLVARRSPKRLVVAGFGSSYTAAQMAEPMLRRHVPIPVFVVVATELAGNPSITIDPETLVVFVSRSGERGWLIDTLAEVRARGAICVALTASQTNLLAQKSDHVIETGEGPEASYPKTKSVLAAASALQSLALSFDKVPGKEWRAHRDALAAIPDLLALAIEESERMIEPLGGWLARHRFAFVTGTGGNVGTAHEGALKIQEAAGLIGQWDNSGDTLHGALGVLNADWVYVGLVTTNDHLLHKSLFELVGSFGADCICVLERGLRMNGSIESVVEVPVAGDPLVAPLLYLPALQMITYFAGTAQGLDMDEPEFSAKMLRSMLPVGREEPDWASPKS
jgi:glucosamine--fructose-6-phosphate aminotransferase (isomerizing)